MKEIIKYKFPEHIIAADKAIKILKSSMSWAKNSGKKSRNV